MDSSAARGFSLIEMLIALFIMTFGLLAAGQLLFLASASASLARSIDVAAIAAQNKVESLSALYKEDRFASDIAIGPHGPQQVEISNPSDETVLNRFQITWNVDNLDDPRQNKALDSRRLNIIVEPIGSTGSRNNQHLLNKTINLAAILNPN
jgi:prepilin-type N-terminal cleavage/methylation domain-containing protein